MRILHISDIHWRGLSRHEEYTNSFEELFRLARQIKPDIIVNTGDTFHTKTQGITPEIIDRLSWMFRGLADIAPSYTILGNHDGNLTNPERQDAITPIHEAVNHPRSFLLKKSGYYDIDDKFCLSVFSPFDKDPWPEMKPLENKINIALFHGAISHCRFGNGHILEKGEKDVAHFEGYDLALLGDIHDHQFLAYRPNRNGDPMPWVGYPGSLIQQNFGETERKGFLVWDIEDREHWKVEWHELPNTVPFISAQWLGSPEATLQSILEKRGTTNPIPHGSRLKLFHRGAISEVYKKNMIDMMHNDYHVSLVSFSPEADAKISDEITLDNSSLTVSKKSLRNDPEALFGLFKEYVTSADSGITINEEQIKEAKKYLSDYIARLNSEISEATGTTAWSIKYLKFDNLFGYGENNFINFESLHGIVGILGKNKIGKSSIIGAIMYALFNATDRGPINGTHVINWFKDYCSAEICFESGGKTYIIERRTERTMKNGIDTKKVANKVNFYEVRGSEKFSCNGESTPETDKMIRKVIGTADDFLLTSLSAQGDLFKFIKEGSTNRKKHLSRFLELNLFDKIHAYAKEDAQAINVSKEVLTEDEWDKKISAIEKAIQSLQKQIDSGEKKKKALEVKKEKVQNWINKYKNKASHADLLTYKDIIEETEVLSATLETKKELQKSIKIQMKDLKREVGSLEKAASKQDRELLVSKVNSLRSFQATMRELNYSLEKEQTKLENQEKSIKRLTTVPCGDSFPDCRFIKDSHEDKSKRASQQKIVEKLSKEFNELSETINELLGGKYEEELNSLDQNENLLKAKQNTLSQLEEKQLRLKAEVENHEVKLKELTGKSKLLKEQLDSKQEEEYAAKVKDMSNILSEIAGYEQESVEHYQMIGRRKLELETTIEDREKTQDATNRYTICASIQKAFHKNAIPAIMLRTQIPAINAEISRILQSATDIKITLEADDNSMDVFLEDNTSEARRIIETCSGMEKTLCSFVLRAALNNISTISKSDIFILDEGFGALDEDNQQSALDMLALFKEYFKTVLVISHEAPIKESVEKMIEIEPAEEGARVWVL